MDTAERVGRIWTAEEFLRTDQAKFGDAWRYELIDGRIVAHAAPAPEHGAILSGLTGALVARLRGNREGCRPETGSGAVPRRQQRNTARIPDAMIRCGDLPRVAFEVVSPSELRQWRARDGKRRDLQEVDDIREIVEIHQDEPAVHVYRKEAAGTWSFEAIEGADATLRLASVGLEIPLQEIYEFAMPGEAEDDG
jgi:Uma2 family endonuclease